ncbi:MAG TPA: lysophospholipid acyltransferase family protein [Candidatus Sulfotelmatobacter sp.]|nr:lysophospholipid acyltransferase family protein [Candidatus Sulfotelmatobacter sp.]
MIVLRAALFQLAFYLWTALMLVAYLPGLAFDRLVIVRGQRQWTDGTVFLLRTLAGIRLELRGLQHRPRGAAAIFAAKHQSAFDTFIFHLLLDDPAIVMKRELLWLPIYGWYCRKTRMIVVDRTAGAAALRRLVADGKAAAALRRPILIFPEGTRAAPDARLPYQPGVSALYGQLDLPVVPVALNSGLFWPRRRFIKRPGTIVVEFLPPIPPGLARKDFVARLTGEIETATARLVAEGRRGMGAAAPAETPARSDA